MKQRTPTRRVAACGLAAVLICLAPGRTAHAADPAPQAAWADGITFSGWIDAGATYNSQRSSSGRNFGRLFDDRERNLQLNEVALTAERKLDPGRPGYDFGFKLQGLYGSDARYTHFLHEFQNATGSSFNQVDVVEANLKAHAPWFAAGGFDMTIGQFPTLEGAEYIEPAANPLYSHSYIFSFGIPSKHTGAITVLHASEAIDVYLGADTGVNTTFGRGDNNRSAAFNGGLGFNLLGGKLSIVALTHIGPENPAAAANNLTLPRGADRKNRYLNDITAEWKLSDKLQLITDLNYAQDDCQAALGNPARCRTARGYGVAQYGVYELNETFTLVARGEVWRDEEGAFVAQFNDNNDFLRGQEGRALLGTVLTGFRTTYAELTAGVNIKPGFGFPHLTGLIVRPELRYDKALNNTRPFADNTRSSQVTLAADVIVQF